MLAVLKLTGKTNSVVGYLIIKIKLKIFINCYGTKLREFVKLKTYLQQLKLTKCKKYIRNIIITKTMKL
jgi:hypothetical protein